MIKPILVGCCLTIVLLPTSGYAQSATVTPEAFDAVYQGCMQQITADQNGTQQQKEIYCGCMRDQVANNHDMVELTKVAAEHQSGGVSEANTRKLEAIAQDCLKKSFAH
ncbi:MAG: hypothetical protein EBV03_10120 [Proteobacteria bacterium]|nr:hypothetical protein [Pseudomonadota bacterium]